MWPLPRGLWRHISLPYRSWRLRDSYAIWGTPVDENRWSVRAVTAAAFLPVDGGSPLHNARACHSRSVRYCRDGPPDGRPRPTRRNGRARARKLKGDLLLWLTPTSVFH